VLYIDKQTIDKGDYPKMKTKSGGCKMRIEIGKFVLESDKVGINIYCPIVRGPKSKRAGTVRDEICGHYSDMTEALIGLHRHVGLRSGATTLQELIQEINDYKTMVLNQINPNIYPELFRRKKSVRELQHGK
jgi:hypothetical protein